MPDWAVLLHNTLSIWDLSYIMARHEGRENRERNNHQIRYKSFALSRVWTMPLAFKNAAPTFKHKSMSLDLIYVIKIASNPHCAMNTGKVLGRRVRSARVLKDSVTIDTLRIVIFAAASIQIEVRAYQKLRYRFVPFQPFRHWLEMRVHPITLTTLFWLENC